MERYLGDQIYTYIGDILIAVNPFKVLPIYDKQVLTRLYRKCRKIDLTYSRQLCLFQKLLSVEFQFILKAKTIYYMLVPLRLYRFFPLCD